MAAGCHGWGPGARASFDRRRYFSANDAGEGGEGEIWGGPKPAPRNLLQAVDGLADEDVHRDATVLRLAFGRLVIRQRISLRHAGRG
jgi:hypothetical protein